SPIPGQKYVCLSFLDPKNVKNCDVRGFKVRGVYATEEEAKERCKQLQSEDGKFNIFLGEVGKWMPFNPELDTVQKVVYYEEELNKLAEAHDEELEKIKKEETERRRKMK